MFVSIGRFVPNATHAETDKLVSCLSRGAVRLRPAAHSLGRGIAVRLSYGDPLSSVSVTGIRIDTEFEF
jgi:hypothetical protein